MVHRKSEYRLQFHILANDVRKQIWLDNLKFRESCRATNQSHHYWSYQVTEDPCECDEIPIVEEEKDDAPMPPHKLKHKFLLSIYGSEKSPEKYVSAGSDAPPVSQSAEFNQQHTESITEATDKREDLAVTRAVNVLESEVPQDVPIEAAEDHLRLQPSAPPLPPCSPVPEPPATFDVAPTHPQSAPSPDFRPFQPSSSWQPGLSSPQKIFSVRKSRQPSLQHQTSRATARSVQKKSPDATGHQLSPIRVSFPTPVVDYGAVHRIPPRPVTPSRGSHGSAGLDSGAQPSPSCLSHPSRTSRKMYSEEKKKQCPFTAFGWNDTNRDVGDKKTYNVSAPEAQVYDNALRALKKRREEIEKFLAKEAALRGHLSACDYGVNHSSIWMSEYREKFGGGTNYMFPKRPVTTLPVRHLNSWRCYS